MPNYGVEVSGEYVETVWGYYTVEAESLGEAEDIAAELFEGENWGIEVISVTATKEDED